MLHFLSYEPNESEETCTLTILLKRQVHHYLCYALLEVVEGIEPSYNRLQLLTNANWSYHHTPQTRIALVSSLRQRDILLLNY